MVVDFEVVESKKRSHEQCAAMWGENLAQYGCIPYPEELSMPGCLGISIDQWSALMGLYNRYAHYRLSGGKAQATYEGLVAEGQTLLAVVRAVDALHDKGYIVVESMTGGQFTFKLGPSFPRVEEIDRVIDEEGYLGIGGNCYE